MQSSPGLSSTVETKTSLLWWRVRVLVSKLPCEVQVVQTYTGKIWIGSHSKVSLIMITNHHHAQDMLRDGNLSLSLKLATFRLLRSHWQVGR